MEKVLSAPTFDEAISYVMGYRAAAKGPKAVFQITTKTDGLPGEDPEPWYDVWLVTGAIWTP